MTHEEDEKFAEVFEHLKAQNLGRPDPMNGPSGRIGGGAPGFRSAVPGPRIGGGWYGYTSSPPKPGEPEYIKTKIGNMTFLVLSVVGITLILYAMWQDHPLW